MGRINQIGPQKRRTSINCVARGDCERKSFVGELNSREKLNSKFLTQPFLFFNPCSHQSQVVFRFARSLLQEVCVQTVCGAFVQFKLVCCATEDTRNSFHLLLPLRDLWMPLECLWIYPDIIQKLQHETLTL